LKGFGDVQSRQIGGRRDAMVVGAPRAGAQRRRLPMVNQQPWIADARHAAMHQPAGPEVMSKLA